MVRQEFLSSYAEDAVVNAGEDGWNRRILELIAARDVDVAALVKSPLPPGLELSKGTPAGPPRIPPSGGCAGCATTPGGLDWATAGLGVLLFYGMTRRARKQGAKR